MPAEAPLTARTAALKLVELGKHIRAFRKTLRISATAAAEAAHMSRVTLFRVEKGEPSVTIGAYLNVMEALGLDFGVIDSAGERDPDLHNGWIPVHIRLSDYPQLKQLAWQVGGTGELTPMEALNIYERNWRHMEPQALEPRERLLIEALREGLGGAKLV